MTSLDFFVVNQEFELACKLTTTVLPNKNNINKLPITSKKLLNIPSLFSVKLVHVHMCVVSVPHFAKNSFLKRRVVAF